MTKFLRTQSTGRSRRLFAPALALAGLGLTAQAAFAVEGSRQLPELRIEAERSPQGARVFLRGKNFPANGRIKVMASRAPGTNTPQDFGVVSADSTGSFSFRKTVGCTTNSMEDARERVQFTAVDSASGAKALARAEGAAWQCL